MNGGCALSQKEAIFYSVLRRHEAVTVACSHTRIGMITAEQPALTRHFRGECNAPQGLVKRSKYRKRATSRRKPVLARRNTE